MGISAEVNLSADKIAELRVKHMEMLQAVIARIVPTSSSSRTCRFLESGLQLDGARTREACSWA
jgi:hypothetical protein